ncbi:MAG: hypothetical protein ACJAVR_002540 [Paracoccaceae bacterium]|jgi:hypothetical protein
MRSRCRKAASDERRGQDVGRLPLQFACPPISRHEAEQVFGAAIPTEAWKKITCAFSRNGQNIDALDTSKSNKNKNDPNSWKNWKIDAEKNWPMQLTP